MEKIIGTADCLQLATNHVIVKSQNWVSIGECLSTQSHAFTFRVHSMCQGINPESVPVFKDPEVYWRNRQGPNSELWFLSNSTSLDDTFFWGMLHIPLSNYLCVLSNSGGLSNLNFGPLSTCLVSDLGQAIITVLLEKGWTWDPNWPIGNLP